MSLKYEPASEPLHISVKYPTPYTLNPQPYTLHPTHYTLHTTHYTLHPTPSTQNSNHKYRSRCLTVAKRRLAEARRDPGTSISMIKWILTSRLSIKTLSLCRSRWLTVARRRLVEARRGPGNSTSYTLHPTLYTLHPTPYTLHPTPYTLHPTPKHQTTSRWLTVAKRRLVQARRDPGNSSNPQPYTLHPTPYTLHPTPYTLTPKIKPGGSR